MSKLKRQIKRRQNERAVNEEANAFKNDAARKNQTTTSLLAALQNDTSAPRDASPSLTQPLPYKQISQGFHVANKRMHQRTTYGRETLGMFLSTRSKALATLCRDRAFDDVDLEHALFFDTETTGLRGAGTLAFVIGVGRFEGEHFVTNQYLLSSPQAEAEILERLRHDIEKASCVVSYNGKSFDWPLLRARYMVQRCQAPLLPPHLDLLPCVRRLFKKRLERLRLIDLEEHVLGVTRKDDLPGALAPKAYKLFLQQGQSEMFQKVVQHNADDIAAMVALLGYILPRIDELIEMDDPWDAVAFAKGAELVKDFARAERFAKHTFNIQRPRGRTLQGHVVRITTCILAHTLSFFMEASF